MRIAHQLQHLGPVVAKPEQKTGVKTVEYCSLYDRRIRYNWNGVVAAVVISVVLQKVLAL